MKILIFCLCGMLCFINVLQAQKTQRASDNSVLEMSFAGKFQGDTMSIDDFVKEGRGLVVKRIGTLEPVEVMEYEIIVALKDSTQVIFEMEKVTLDDVKKYIRKMPSGVKVYFEAIKLRDNAGMILSTPSLDFTLM